MPPLEYSPFIWPFVASAFTTGALGVYAFRRGHIPAATTFAWGMVALTFWTFCYVMELSSATLAGKVFWASAKYPGSTSGPLLWFVLSIQLTRKGHWLANKGFSGLLWGFALLTCLVVFTNRFHHWFWTSLRMVPGEPESQAEHGWFFWVYAAGLYLVILTSVVLFFRYYRTTPAFYRRQAAFLALGGFIPLGGRILEDFFGVDLFPKVDNVILLLLFSSVFYALALFRYGALDIVHIAHNLVIQNMEAGIIVLDVLGRVVELNPYARELVGSTLAPSGGGSLPEALPDWLDLRGPDGEIRVPRGKEQAFFQMRSSPIKEANGALAGRVVVLFDITARKVAERQLERLARTDPLTGVSHRGHFFERARAEFARARRDGHPISLLMFDIDHFKNVNDAFGHQVGDEVLKYVAARCQRQLRASDILARYGGEEFIGLLAESSQGGAQTTAERIRHAIEEAPLAFDGHTISVTISIGLADAAPADGITLEELVCRADHALYESKARGRNQVCSWRDEIVAVKQ